MGVNSISVGGSFNNYNGLSCGKQGGDIEIKDREREKVGRNGVRGRKRIKFKTDFSFDVGHFSGSVYEHVVSSKLGHTKKIL